MLELRLLGWQAEGFRCPDHKIDLSVRKTPSRVSLIQMPNGTGKTTTLTLLRLTLGGHATLWSPAQLRELAPQGGRKRRGSFVVRLGFGQRRLTLTLIVDFEAGSAKYRTSFGAGESEGFRPPAELSRFLNPTFVSLFVFDGELATELLNTNKTRALAAIDALFMLGLLADVRSRFERHWSDYSKNRTATEPRAYARRKNLLERLIARRAALEEERRGILGTLPEVRTRAEAADGIYRELLTRGDQLGNDIAAAVGREAKTTERVGQLLRVVMERMRDPIAVLPARVSALLDLRNGFDRLKLPSTTSRQFFDELLGEAACLCGRELGAEERAFIAAKASEYLGDDEIGALNAIKTEIARCCEGDAPAESRRLDEDVNALLEAVKARSEAKTRLLALEQRRLSEGGPELEARRAEAEAALSVQRKLEERLAVLEAAPSNEDDEETESIPALSRLIDEAEEKLAEITDTLRLRQQTQIVSGILQEGQENARARLQLVLRDEANKRAETLLGTRRVRVKEIGNALVLQGQAGASVGQTLSVAYAFLGTLFNRTEYSLPFIVDSPAGALDLAVRPQVAALIPEVCRQFVAFTISSERQKFVEELESACGGDVQFLTLFRDPGQELGLKRLASKKNLATAEGVYLVEDRKFFMGFDIEAEN